MWVRGQWGGAPQGLGDGGHGAARGPPVRVPEEAGENGAAAVGEGGDGDGDSAWGGCDYGGWVSLEIDPVEGVAGGGV